MRRSVQSSSALSVRIGAQIVCFDRVRQAAGSWRPMRLRSGAPRQRREQGGDVTPLRGGASIRPTIFAVSLVRARRCGRLPINATSFRPERLERSPGYPRV
jgi:hypothetical protein